MMDVLIVKLTQDINSQKNHYKLHFVTNVKQIVLNVFILTPKLIVTSVKKVIIYKIIIVYNATNTVNNAFHNPYVLNDLLSM